MSLNVATILIASTVLGTSENDQIHFFYHYQEKHRTGASTELSHGYSAVKELYLDAAREDRRAQEPLWAHLREFAELGAGDCTDLALFLDDVGHVAAPDRRVLVAV